MGGAAAAASSVAVAVAVRDPTNIPRDARLYSGLVSLDVPLSQQDDGRLARARVAKQVDAAWLARRRREAPHIMDDLPFATRDMVEPKVRGANLSRTVPFSTAASDALLGCCEF